MPPGGETYFLKLFNIELSSCKKNVQVNGYNFTLIVSNRNIPGHIIPGQVMLKPWPLVCFSVAVINMTTKRNLEEDRFASVYTSRSHNPSLMEVRTGTQEETEIETMEKCHSPAYSPTYVQLVFSHRSGLPPKGGTIHSGLGLLHQSQQS